MEYFSFVFTIFFMLLGPVKTLPAFAAATRNMDEGMLRKVALRAAIIAGAVVAFVALAGTKLLGNYHISIDALRIAGGIVLLLAATSSIFGKVAPPAAPSPEATPMQVAVAPVTSPIIVPPAGIAAILIFTMLAPETPGAMTAIAVALAIIIVLNFLAMHFNRAIMRTSGLLLVLQLLGAVLAFMQVALAIETILVALRHLGVVAVT